MHLTNFMFQWYVASWKLGSLVWSAFHKKNLAKIEFSLGPLRFIVRSDMDCKGRLFSCSLLPLSFRREILDITFLFKYRQGLHALDPSDFANEFHPMRRARRSDKEPIYTSLPFHFLTTLCTEMDPGAVVKNT